MPGRDRFLTKEKPVIATTTTAHRQKAVGVLIRDRQVAAGQDRRREVPDQDHGRAHTAATSGSRGPGVVVARLALDFEVNLRTISISDWLCNTRTSK